MHTQTLKDKSNSKYLIPHLTPSLCMRYWALSLGGWDVCVVITWSASTDTHTYTHAHDLWTRSLGCTGMASSEGEIHQTEGERVKMRRSVCMEMRSQGQSSGKASRILRHSHPHVKPRHSSPAGGRKMTRWQPIFCFTWSCVWQPLRIQTYSLNQNGYLCFGQCTNDCTAAW